ncbi:hypothetical protein BDZ94DRAFT_1293525 [Collybia nuda]|uniref:Uncharacterized protein n=1 Tax=Collybia nuda TaxID=64659 RepID=A0A9P6CRC5_9AGAR|nr:hypothetical protein BDZ94DRAFT_1293525 [Collybia nuda]
MPFSTAPALLVGLGARILLDTFTRSGEASIRDFVLIGVWQGVGLHYASKNSNIAIFVGIGIFIKLLAEFNLANDATRSATTLLGVALGVLCTEFLSQFFDSGNPPDSDRRRKKVSTLVTNGHVPRRERVVQFRSSVEGDTSDVRYQAFRHNVSDITSIDSNSEMIGSNSSTMTPLDRDIAALRTRASLADSERRRFKEERKWAISQGNTARAAQMKWQVKRYTALMQSFHREADAKLIEASGGRPRRNHTGETKNLLSKSNRRDELINGPVSRASEAHFKRNNISKSALRDVIR